jgi:transposase-like protein
MRNRLRVMAKRKWLYAAIDIQSKLLLEVDVFSRPQNARVLVFERDASVSSTPRD